MKIAYVKGQFIAENKAMVSVQERGFRFGDGVFESIRFASRKPAHLSRHLKRLTDGLEALIIPSPQENLADICAELIAQNTLNEGVIRINISRGIGSAGYLPTALNSAPTVVVELMELPPPITQPLTLWHSSWQKPPLDALPVQHKISHGINSTLARIEAQKNGCDEALILNAKGEICEASSANIFWKKDDIIYTPADDCGLLKGIAREILLETWQVKQVHASLETLKNADSIILCNSIRGAMAVNHLAPNGWKWNNNSLEEQANAILKGFDY